MEIRKHSQTSNTIRVILKHSSTGASLTGLLFSSAGLIISTICDNEASATVYTQASSNIETITTLGTFATPTTNKCRFKEVDATNHPGLYEMQFANARFSVSSAKFLIIQWSGATNLLSDGLKIELTQIDPFATIGSAVQMKKNVQYDYFKFTMELTDGTGATGKTVTATRAIDNGAFASCANSVVEVSNSVYRLTLAASDLNGGDIMLRLTATGCKDRFIKIVTQV